MLFLLHGLNLGRVEAVGVEGAVAVIGEVWAGAVDAFGNANMSSAFFACGAVLFMMFVRMMAAAFTADDHVSSTEEQPMSPSLACVTKPDFVALNPTSALTESAREVYGGIHERFSDRSISIILYSDDYDS